MIPFNHLGWVFDRFSAAVYPEGAIAHLCEAVAGLRADAAVLDLGAGTGTLGNYARRCRGDLRLIAADPAAGMLKYVPEAVHAVLAKAEALPFDSGEFAAVLVGEALHHFDMPRDAFREIARVLHPGGLLYVYDFDPSTFMGRSLRRAEMLLGEPGHFYPPGDLAAQLEALGFSCTVRRYGWRYSLLARLNGQVPLS